MWRMRSTVVGEARFLRFLVVARRIAAREGVMAVSFDSLARASGSPKPTIQSYFGTAAELRSNVVEDWYAAVQRFVFAPAAQKLGLRRVWVAIHCWLVLHREFSAPIELLREGPTGAKAQEWNVLRGRVASLLKQWDAFLAEALSDAMTCGEIPAETDRTQLLEQLASLTTNIGTRSGVLTADTAMAQAVQTAWGLLQRAATHPERALPPRDDAVTSLISDATERIRAAEQELQASTEVFGGASPDRVSPM